MKNTFIIGGVRTAIGKLGGNLAHMRTDDLAAASIQALVEKYSNLDQNLIGDVIFGCANQAGEDNRNVARMALLLAGLPFTIPGETINRLCASGMSAIIHGHHAIQVSDAQYIIAGGVESMTRAPWVLSKTSSAFGRDVSMYDSSFGWRFINEKMRSMYGVDSMGQTAENLASMYKISREEQDLFALQSQIKTETARKNKLFDEEIFSLEVQNGKQKILFDNDEFPKPNSTLEVLSNLKPSFSKDGTVTAGNSSGLNDGSAALLLASSDSIIQLKEKPLARVVSYGVTGVEPRIMGIGPVSASQMALKRANLSLDQIDIIEINEAFAAQVLACLKEFKIDQNDARLNVNGGSIALGHPLGMSGSRIVLTAANELKRKKLKYALCTMCIGVGQGMAIIIENVN